MYTTYPFKVEHTSFFTDADGDLILPETLKLGNYRIEEVKAPDRYVLNTDYITVKVDTDTAYETDPDELAIAGAVFGLYAGEDIKDTEENVIVETGILLETAFSAKIIHFLQRILSYVVIYTIR